MRKRFHFNFLSDILGEEVEYRKKSFFRKGYTEKPSFFHKAKRKGVKKTNGGFKGGYAPSYRKTYYKSGGKQNCIFKSNHRYDKAFNKKHFDYIQREGKGRNGGLPSFTEQTPKATKAGWPSFIGKELVTKFVTKILKKCDII